VTLSSCTYVSGVLYHRWKKFHEAEKMYRKALQLDPDSPNTKEYLSRVLQKLKNNEKGLLNS